MSESAKARMGVQLRRLRQQHGLTQATFAEALGISPSYVNQMEFSKRPITEPILLRLVSVFGADIEQFSAEPSDRLVAQLRDVLGDDSLGDPVSAAEARELATSMPAVGRFLVELHRRYRHSQELHETIATGIDAGTSGAGAFAPPMAYEQVRDLFYTHRNYLPTLDTAAEELFTRAALTAGDTADGLVAYLSRRHGTSTVNLSAADSGSYKRRFDRRRNVLALSPLLTSGQRAFQLATHLATVELAGPIEELVAGANLSSEETRALARIGLANYVAGALILPYRLFLNAAESTRYDIDLLAQQFQVSYETVAHRLSSLQRPGLSGVPFFFVRVDRAGNISKRQSATGFHFSRVGGSCPLWNVYESFAYPTEIRAQLAQMPDGRSYLWVARAVTRRTGGYRTPAQTFAIGLGCDLRHAHRLVYSDGLDLANPSALTPIGPGCKVCDRHACPQRAFPVIGRPLDVDRDHTPFAPYVADTAVQ